MSRVMDGSIVLIWLGAGMLIERYVFGIRGQKGRK